ncbi:hypothetical protein ARMGADRAFT_1036584 [Armillaria gallica]|uniref:Uncharacterized protein n=1 Tax=Armillaria gallica TaxID=47427 RepID=A0A2H3CPV2_ARMGA|nr:hypothetical protein ARMGADRAFT_1036584 [Armillaria gallica]
MNATLTDQIVIYKWNAKWVKKAGIDVWGGIFTNLLIKTLRSGVLKDRATYVDLIKALPQLRSQMPVTEVLILYMDILHILRLRILLYVDTWCIPDFGLIPAMLAMAHIG